MNAKTLVAVLAAATLGFVLVVAGVWLGATLVGNDADAPGARWGGMGPGMMHDDWEDMPCADEGYANPGMRGGRWGDMPCESGYIAPESERGDSLSLEQAGTAVERYVEQLGYSDLHVTELMEFERNFYAIVAEDDTGIGAMELLVDRVTGVVGPEPGPNMMWNAKYGMHRGGGMKGMMNQYAGGEMTLAPEEAENVAQRWLDDNLPGRTAGEADPFYGYYTLHYLQDGEIEGMLSVHGSSGDVWVHTWHGGFVAMTEEHG
jgi:hypothetical protein